MEMRFKNKVRYKMNCHSQTTFNSLNILISMKYLDNFILNCEYAINGLLLYLLYSHINEVTIANNSFTTM